MRSLVILAALGLAACGNSSYDYAYVSGLDATARGVTVCRTMVTRTQKPFDCCADSYDERVAWSAFDSGDGHVVGRGDGDVCAASNGAPPLPVALDHGTRVVVEPDAATGGVDAIAADAAGNERWRTPISLARVTRAAHDASSIYLTDGNDVVRLDAADGVLRWDAALSP